MYTDKVQITKREAQVFYESSPNDFLIYNDNKLTFSKCMPEHLTNNSFFLYFMKIRRYGQKPKQK